ncbi:MAG: ParA family protein [Acidimicrobiales bacterium]
MNVLAVYNSKGGVGKTATAVNLAHQAAQHGYRTLLWDLDPQGAATFYLRVPHRLRGGTRALTTKRHRIGERIVGTDIEGLDVLPSDQELRHIDVVFDATKHRTRRLSRVVEELSTEGYDLLIIDCPPSSSLVAENIFHAAHVLVVPVVPSTLSVRTLELLDQTLLSMTDRRPATVVFFSMADGRKKLHRQVMAELRATRTDLATTVIPAATDVELMGTERAPVATFAPSSPAARAYRGLWGELVARGYTERAP